MEQTNQNFKCSGDCLNCRAVNDRKIQWQYCAAQFSYNALRTMQSIQETITAISGEVKELKDKIEAIQNSEATVFDPNKEMPDKATTPPPVFTPIAHEGTGAAQ